MIRLATSVVFSLALLAKPFFASGQDHSHEVDQVFAAYAQPMNPGCSVGIVHGGRFVYQKSYGSASLELDVPLSPKSVFYVGSIAKQFTAASIVLAAEQGYLSLDDNIRKYIPELPAYGHDITLREMLQQTSGFRDFFDLIYLSGHDSSEFNTPSEIFGLIKRQKGLNNVPGAEWIYSNTNYFLLGIVLQRASGKTLAAFAAENIFRPLGMKETSFYDDASVVVPGRVAAYNAGPNGRFLVNWSTNYAVVGGGGLMTTVDDLLRWDNNFYANHLGKGTLRKELETPGVLNDGNKISYGMGLIPGNYRGLPIIEHNGSNFGYTADLLRFPNQRFTVITLCNVSNANPEEKSRQVADLYLMTEMQPDSTPIDAVDKHLPPPDSFAGQYFDQRTRTIYSFTSSNGHLRAWGSDLRRKNANQFYDLFGDLFTFEGSGTTARVTLDMNGERYFAGTRRDEIHLDKTALQSFVGNFKSSELDGAVHLAVEHNNLIFKAGTNPPIPLAPIANDEFHAGSSFWVVFRRNKRGQVSGLRLFMPSARGLEFVRND
ncbi:MAG: serine hydrolase [Edaphobacter sp.]|uniref:serine hydrolase domain-containing protein n=1 Tax=Edaphobacter sp. TaxID=1934404 RepID=UPI002386B8B3|nr:serine hydrolase domain-containing protein [Edaphobacter sp.]MDE1175303.1 serine hydrolase [Edaphobacter sp.]